MDIINNIKMGNAAGILGVYPSGSGNPPSNDPNDWTWVDQDILHPNNIYGIQCIPREIVKLESGFGLFYEAKKWGDDSFISNTAASIAFSTGGVNFTDYWGNPVLYKTQKWSSGGSVCPRCLIYNPNEKIYYCPYIERNSGPYNYDYYGRQVIGLAWSKDLKKWTHKSDAPWLTHEDAENIFSSFDGDTTDYSRIGRLYGYMGEYHDGWYYFQTNYGWMRFQDWDGPYEEFEFESGDRQPSEGNIVYYDGKYYSSFASSERLLILEADNFEGPYTFTTGSDSNALFTEQTYDDSHLEVTRLFMWDDVWYLMYGVRQGKQVAAAYPNISHGGSKWARVMRLGYYDPLGKLS